MSIQVLQGALKEGWVGNYRNGHPTGADVLIKSSQFVQSLNRRIALCGDLNDKIGYWLCSRCKQASFDKNLSHKKMCLLSGTGNRDTRHVIYVTGPNERGSTSDESPFSPKFFTQIQTEASQSFQDIDVSSYQPPRPLDIRDPNLNTSETEEENSDFAWDKPKLRIGIPIVDDEKSGIKMLKEDENLQKKKIPIEKTKRAFAETYFNLVLLQEHFCKKKHPK